MKGKYCPYKPDAWIDHEKSVVGYTIPFNRCFYEYKPLPSVEKLERELKELEENHEKLVAKLFGKK